MGSALSGLFGIKSDYQATPYQQGNPYDQNVLQNELQNQSNIYARQEDLGNTLQQQMAGNGPNPAQTQYQQNVQQNIAQAQGLMSGNRGTNAALATKMGGNVAAEQNQKAASQSALQQQMQQLQATQSYGNLLGQMQTGNLAQQQLYVNPNVAAMQTNAAVANANQQGAQGVAGGLMGAMGLVGTSLAKGGMVPGKNYDDGGMVDSDSPDSSTGDGPQSSAGKYFKGMNSQGITNQGGMGQQAQSPVLSGGFGALGPMGGTTSKTGSFLGQSMSKIMKPVSKMMGGESKGNKGSMPGGGMSDVTGGGTSVTGDSMGLEGGTMGNAAGAGEAEGAAAGEAASGAEMSELAALAAHGGQIKKRMDFRSGGHVPGKAKHAGDNLKNDTVPAMVSPGEIVIPRSVINSKDAPDASAKFVAAILARQGLKRK